MRAATRLRLLFAIAVVVIASAFCLLPNASADPAVSNYYEQMVKSDGALAYWRFDETSGLTINDATSASSFDGRWYDPLYMGRTPTLGVSGVSLLSPNRAVQLNGDGIASTPFGQVVAPGSSLNPTSFSVEAWVKPTDLPDPWTYAGDDSETIICSRDLYDQKGYMLFLGAYSDHAQFALNAGNNLRPPAEKNLIVDTTSPAIQRGQWYHVVATIDGSVNPVAMHLYVNGVDAGHVEYEGAFYRNNAGTDTLIGKGSRYDPGTGVHSTEYGFPGVLDEVAIYGRVLSETDVLEHYSQGTPTAPVNEVSPTISGIAKDGESLNVSSNGSWSGTQPMSFSYQWQRCDVSCDDIAGATNGSYTLTTSDIDRTIRLRVKADSVAGSTSEVSDETDPIEPRQLLNTSLPTISGTAQDTHVLTGSLGSWSGSGQIHLHYQWQSCVGATHGDCDPIGDLTDVDYPHSADDVKYTLTSDEVGRVIELQVTADDDYGSDSIDAWSARTAVVLGSVPVSTSLPTIEGILETDETLTGHDADWIGTEPFTSTKLQWLRCSSASDCSPISSETSETYQLKKTDIGYLFELQVTKTNDYGSTTATSAQTAPVQPVTPTNISPPTISGAAKDGVELKGNKGNWKGTADLIDAYQWLRCDEAVSSCASIDGATSEAYKLQKVDIGSKIVFRVAVTNDYGTASVDSDPTAVVEASPPENTTLPTITGLVRDGVTLTAWEGEWNGTVPITYAFQWRLCDEDGALDSCTDITGATTASYTVTTADIGHTIRVRVTAKNVTGIDVAAVSPATGAAEPEPLTNTARPVVTGSAMVGQILSTIGGSWTGSPPIDHYFHWLRCDSNGNACSKIEGATEKSYKVAGPDINHRLRVEELAVNAAGQLTAESESTETVSPWVSSESDYAIQLTAAPNDVLAAGSVVYEVKVRNSRSSSIYIDHLDITLPEGFSFVPGSTRGDVTLAPLVDGRTLGWAGVPEVAAGKTASFQFDVQAGGVGGTFTSDLAATVLSLEPLTLTKVAPVTVETEPTMKLKSDVDWVPVGGSATITGTIFNPTSSPLPVSSAKAVLPIGLEYEEGSATLGEPEVIGQLITWGKIDDVPARGQREFSFSVTNTKTTKVYTVISEVALAGGSEASALHSSSLGEQRSITDVLPLSGEDIADFAYLYRPYLYFDSDEVWRPLNVETYLKEISDDTHDWAHQVCARGQCTPSSLWDTLTPKECKDVGYWRFCDPFSAVVSLTSAGAVADTNDAYIADTSDDYRTPGFPAKCRQNKVLCDHDKTDYSKIYYHGHQGHDTVNKYDGSLYLDYYFFYRYNKTDPSAVGFDEHEADWEGLLVKLSPQVQTGDEDPVCTNHGFSWIGFHAHTGLYKYSCSVLKWASSSHVRAYVANGTHATYPQKCTNEHCMMNEKAPVPVVNYQEEARFDGGAPWGYNTDESPDALCRRDKCLIEISSRTKKNRSPEWAFWMGDWSSSYEQLAHTKIVVKGPGGKGAEFDHPERSSVTKCDRTAFDQDTRRYALPVELCEEVPIPRCVNSGLYSKCNTTVPNVVGYKRSRAIKKLTKKGLTYEENDVYSKRPESRVIKQSPASSSKWVPKGTSVTLKVAVRKHMPSVRGLTENMARKVLSGEDYKLKVAKKTKLVYDSEMEGGRVATVDPKPGSGIAPSDKVVLVLSRGTKPKLIEVRGWKPEKARKKLQGKPWKAKVAAAYGDAGYSYEYTNGTIGRTKPVAGTPVGEDDVVTFFISKGHPRMLDVRGWTPKMVGDKLSEAPWRVGYIAIKNGKKSRYCAGTVEKSVPASAERLKTPKVTLYISKGIKGTNNTRCEKIGENETQAIFRRIGLGYGAGYSLTRNVDSARSDADRNNAPTRKTTKRTRSLAFLKTSESGESCGNWFGPMVIALACSKEDLGNADSGKSGGSATFAMDVDSSSTVSAAGPGYAQVLGSVFKPGGKASLYGTAPGGTQLGIRLSTSGGGVAEAVFDDVGLAKGGRVDLTVRKDGADSKKDGVPDAELRIGGKVKRPAILLVRPGSPRLLALKATKRGVRIRFKANSSKTGIKISGSKSTIAVFSIKTRKGRKKQIALSLAGRRPQTVSLVSYGKNGMNSATASVTRPSKPWLAGVTRTSKGISIRFSAKTKKTRVVLYGASGKRVAALSVKAKVGASKRILIRLDGSHYVSSVSLVSLGRYGFNSLPAIRRVR